ncbi:aminoacylase 1A [Trichuris trichiura]|uniref:Aminoacylase 1A n=1 Tax=Trichuris trichiura TaxID=36087 RepID=A0A077YVU1_TRITR|nr:aminoacylase 1A [Trichuris trichiura]
MEDNDCVARFQQYLRIRTDHPNPDYDGAISFLSAVAQDFGLPYRKLVFTQNKPILLVTLEGQEPSLPSIFLSSHMDVVPALLFKEYSFDGKVLLSIWFVLADEEVGSIEGMGKFVETEEFRLLNVGLCLDEGVASEDDIYRVYYAERSLWWLKVIASGNSGHASTFVDDTAAEKLFYVTGKFLQMREEEKAKLLNDHCLTVGDVMSANLTMLSKEENTTVSPNSTNNLWWRTIANVFEQLEFKYRSEVFHGGTDARYLRSKGYDAYGFSPIICTPMLLHDHNEYIERSTYLKGINIYVHLIASLANAC